MPDSAVVYVPATLTDPAAFAVYAAPCLERVEACGYEFGGIVRTWDDALGMLNAGQAHVLIVATRGDLPPDRHPRIEAVTDPVVRVERHLVLLPDTEAIGRRRRRPRRVR